MADLDYKSEVERLSRKISLCPPGSQELALGLSYLARLHRRGGDPAAALYVCERAQPLALSLGMQGSPVYTGLLHSLAGAHNDLGHQIFPMTTNPLNGLDEFVPVPEAAKAHFLKALEIIDQFKPTPASFLALKAEAYAGLRMFPEAASAHRETYALAQSLVAADPTTDNLLSLATCSINRARFQRVLFAFDRCIEGLREGLAIRLRVLGDSDPLVVSLMEELKLEEEFAKGCFDFQQSADIRPRECSYCLKIDYGLLVCTGCSRACYCNSECRKNDLPRHSLCRCCWVCGSAAPNKCSGCHIARFCSDKCAKLFWPHHKKDCKRSQEIKKSYDSK